MLQIHNLDQEHVYNLIDHLRNQYKGVEPNPKNLRISGKSASLRYSNLPFSFALIAKIEHALDNMQAKIEGINQNTIVIQGLDSDSNKEYLTFETAPLALNQMENCETAQTKF